MPASYAHPSRSGSAASRHGIAAASRHGSAGRSRHQNLGRPALQRLARREARSLLDEASLPPGSERSAGEPEAAGKKLRSGGPVPANPLRVNRHAYWVVPEGSTATRTWIESHGPKAMGITTRGESGYAPGLKPPLHPGERPQITTVTSYTIGYSTGKPSSARSERYLTFTVLPSQEGPTYVRVDADVVPILQRPARERVPAAARAVEISAVMPFGHRGATTSPPPFTIAKLSKVRRIAHLIDRLPRSQPGTFSCPMENGSSLTFRFEQRSGGRAIAVVKAEATGCGGVSITLHGRRLPGLTGGVKLVKHVEKLLGARGKRLPRAL